MAQRRMFSKHVCDTDAFMDMPLSAQALYLHLLLRADDDGFVSSPKKIARMLGTQDDDMKVLVGKKFLIPFDSGVCVIKHWRIHNYIQSDRYRSTTYEDEKACLVVKDNGSYTLDTGCIQDVSKPDTQVRLGKVSIGKDRLETQERGKYGEDKNVRLSDEEYGRLVTDLGERPTLVLIEELDQYISQKGKDPYKSHKATIKAWFRRRMQEQADKRRGHNQIADV